MTWQRSRVIHCRVNGVAVASVWYGWPAADSPTGHWWCWRTQCIGDDRKAESKEAAMAAAEANLRENGL
jgi:hypothetical protein